jgi:hypothetical protein
MRNQPSCFSEHKLRSCTVLLFLFRGQGCAYLSLQMKAIKLHLTLLTSSSHMVFIICSPYFVS